MKRKKSLKKILIDLISKANYTVYILEEESVVYRKTASVLIPISENRKLKIVNITYLVGKVLELNESIGVFVPDDDNRIETIEDLVYKISWILFKDGNKLNYVKITDVDSFEI